MAKNKIFQGFGTGAGVAAGTTPAKVTITTPAAPKAAANPFSAGTASASSAPNPFITAGPVSAFGGSPSGQAGGNCGGRCKNSERCVNGECVPKNDGTGNVCQNDNQCGQNKRCIGGYCVDKGSTGPVAPPPSTGRPPTGAPPPERSPGGGGGTPPPANVCSAANPQGECPPGQLCDNGSCRSLPANNITGGDANDNPEEYYRYLIGRGGLHMNSSNALGAFIGDQYDSLYKDYKAAWLQNPNLNWNDFLTRTFGPEQMVADFMRRKFLGSSAAQQGYNPSEYGSGPARWSVF